jgi:hypothetical protein
LDLLVKVQLISLAILDKGGGQQKCCLTVIEAQKYFSHNHSKVAKNEQSPKYPIGSSKIKIIH